MHDRLRIAASQHRSIAASDRSYRELGELTSTHPETVRRYMQGAVPNVEFLSAFATALEVSIEWLLNGTGTMRQREVRGYVLREASVTELLNAMAATIEKLISRVERIEVYIQTLETRIRANAPSLEGKPVADTNLAEALARTNRESINGAQESQVIEADNAQPETDAVDGQASAAASTDARARSIADALPKRARPDGGGTSSASGS